MENNINLNNENIQFKQTETIPTPNEERITKKRVGRPKKLQTENSKEEDSKNEIIVSSKEIKLHEGESDKIKTSVSEEQSIEWYTCDLKTLIGKRPFKNFQPVRNANIELYKKIGCYAVSMIPFLLKTMGFNYKNIPVCNALILTTRLAPITVEKLLVIEASGPATAKTSTLSYLGNYPLIIEEPSRADLTGNKKFKTQTGLIKEDIIQIDEAGNMVIPDELIGIIKAITSQDEYSKNGIDKIDINLSIIFTGNPSKEYFNSDGKTLNIDYCIKNLRELSLSLVEKFDYALIDRAIVTPGFLLSPIESNYILQKNEEIPKILFKDNTPSEIKIFEDFSLNVHTLWNTYIKFRSEDLFYISDEIKNNAQDTTDRSITAINTLYTAFKRMYDPNNNYSKEKDLGLQELALTYRNYANGLYQPLNKGYIRYLLVDIAKMIIQKDDIEEIYVHKHRILLKPKNEYKFYKVALDLEGQKENELEYKFHHSCSEKIREFLPKIFSFECAKNVLVQEYSKPFSSSKALKEKIESPLEKELKRWKEKCLKMEAEYVQFKENVYNAFIELVEQIKYNSENMLRYNEINFYENDILSALTIRSKSSAFDINLEAELKKFFPNSDIIYCIKSYDVSLENGLKFINFYNLNSEDLI